MRNIRDKLNKGFIFWDGGMGTLLQEAGLTPGELPESWNITHPDRVIEIQKRYLIAGADAINTNTFGANRLKYPDDLEEVVRAGVEIAKQAREEALAAAGAESSEGPYVALDIGPTGKLLKPLGDLDFEDAVEIFAEVVRAGSEAGADLVQIETMTDTYELKAAVLAAKENSDLPVFATVTFDESGKLMTGADVRTVVTMLEGLGVDALGVNCSLGPAELLPIVKELVRESSVPVIVSPNAGLPKTENGHAVYSIGPDEFAGLMTEIAKCGVQVLGGCCGTTPEHIEKMTGRVRELPFAPVTEKHHTRASSFARTVEFITGRVSSYDGAEGKTAEDKSSKLVPLVVGERVNPTGKTALKQALRENDISYILNEAVDQEEAGADILDINVGLPDIDEPLMMERAVTEVQGVTALPLEIDTSDTAALERALRRYNGKAIINSVNGREDSLSTVLPIAAKYGGVLVALTLDENGIPDNAEERVRIAEKIIKAAAEHGIPKKDIVVDGLTLTVSSGEQNGRVTLDTVRKLRDELGVATILGVSNVSFGLPDRENINQSFLTMALASGLSAAIMDPLDRSYMNAFSTSLALLGFDENSESYIESHTEGGRFHGAGAIGSAAAQGKEASNVSKGARSTEENGEDGPGSQTAGGPGPEDGAGLEERSELFTSIIRGLKAEAAGAAKAALSGRKPLDIINEDLIPALDVVGKGFEKGTVFLPKLLMSAEATKSAFTEIKKAMPESGASKGKVIVATVKGDIHDIGKNIVKVLLENYGYKVFDLGRDVEPAAVLEKVREEGVTLVGLSALMTTTVSSMQETIELLRKETPGTKVVVGGAVMNEEYAEMIGADKYAPDAMATVRYAEECL